MKLHTLQLFLRSLLEPLAQCSTPAGDVEALRRACDYLALHGELTLDEFSDRMHLANEYAKTKEILVPAYLRPIVSCHEKVLALKRRATAADGNRDEVVQEMRLVPLDKLDKADLIEIGNELGGQTSPKATKAQAIDALWRAVTGESKPVKKPREGARATSSFAVNEYAQKVTDLKERANSADTTREEVEQGLKQLELEKLTAVQLRELARELACPVDSRTNKTQAIEAIERSVLPVKETIIGAAT